MAKEAETKTENPDDGSMFKLRNLVLIIVFCTVYIIGIPLWKNTTTIYRASLPYDEIEGLESYINNHLKSRVDIFFSDATLPSDSISEIQTQVDRSIEEKYPQLNDLWGARIVEGSDSDNHLAYLINFHYLKDNVDIFRKEHQYSLSATTRDVDLKVTESAKKDPRFSKYIADFLIDHIFKEEIEAFQKSSFKEGSKNLAMPYSSKYNIVISLMIEDGTSVSWDIESVMDQLNPIFEGFKHFANFSITTQVQYFSSLTVSPEFSKSKNSYILKESDLGTFVNFADWNLNNMGSDPNINFLVYLSRASLNGTPLIIENSHTNSFFVPQWGGVHILNPKFKKSKSISKEMLLPVMEIFISQFFNLLGISSKKGSPIFMIDSLTRVTTIRNIEKASEGLKALVYLTNSLNEISIPEATKNKVTDALSYIKSSIDSLKRGDFETAMRLSAKGLASTDDAFFEKEIVQQAYFPSEHKLAVFLPLIGPISSIIILEVIKLVKKTKV